MKSRAQIKSHPLHPILVAFPIAFFVGSWMFDLVWWAMGIQGLWRVSYWLQIAGVFFGLLAAIPGFIDFLQTVPPKSSASKRAAKHGILNSIVLVLFLTIWFLRQSGIEEFIVVLLDTIGVGILSVAGWLGGTLVYRNQIGVDHRYAHAGKWKELDVDFSNGPIKVAALDELKENQMKLIHVGNKRVVLARTEGKYVAFDDHCTHRGASLADGSLACSIVQCPWHGSQFDVVTGKVKAGPAEASISCYGIVEKDGAVFLNLGNSIQSS